MKKTKTVAGKKPLFGDIGTLRPLNFLGLTVSGIINSIGVTVFLAPINLFDSGFSGTSMLLYQLTPPWLTLSMFLVVLNLPFFIFGLKKQGAAFTVYSVYAILIYSVSAYLIQHVLPIAVDGSSPIAGTDPFLCAIFGGMISGIGSGLTIRFGGAIDGVEVMAVIFAKYIGLTIGTFVMIYNAILYVIAALIFTSWTIPLYSVVAYALGLKAVDFVVEGLDKAKAAFIISAHADEIAAQLSEQLGRGITLMDGRGFYSGEPKTVLYCVVNRFQIGRLKRIVTACDKTAFVTITDVSDTLGASLKLSLPLRKNKTAGNEDATENEASATGENITATDNAANADGKTASGNEKD